MIADIMYPNLLTVPQVRYQIHPSEVKTGFHTESLLHVYKHGHQKQAFYHDLSIQDVQALNRMTQSAVKGGPVHCASCSVAIGRLAHHNVTIYKMVFGDNGIVISGCFQRTASGGDSPQSKLHVPNRPPKNFGTFCCHCCLTVQCHVSLFSGNNSYPHYITYYVF